MPSFTPVILKFINNPIFLGVSSVLRGKFFFTTESTEKHRGEGDAKPYQRQIQKLVTY
jgi:hypothetical protein